MKVRRRAASSTGRATVFGGRPRGGLWRSRWAAIGAAAAVTLGAGGLALVNAESAESSFVAVSPTRVLDTRAASNVGLVGPFRAFVGRTLPITGSIPTVTSADPFTVGDATVVPDGATAVVLNVTATNTVSPGFVSVRPGDQTDTPATSNLNFSGAGITIPNAVTVELPTSGAAAGQVNVFYGAAPGTTVDIIVDIVGYYTEATGGGAQGPPGPAGPQGPTGPAGPAGQDGTDGQDGTNGQDGLDGQDGRDGSDAANAKRFGYDIVYSADIVDDDRVAFASTAIAVGVDGNPIIAHRDVIAERLRITHCNDPACATSTTTSPDNIASSGSPAIAIGSDGLPIVAHQVNDLDLRLTRCNDIACTDATGTTIDTLGLEQIGFDPSIAIGIDGRPLIAHYHPDAGGVRVTVCNVAACTNASSTTLAVGAAPTDNAGLDPVIEIGSDGLPVIAHQDDTNKTLRVSRCTTAVCTATTGVTVDAGVGGADVGFSPSMVIDADGFPAIAHLDETNQLLRVVRCAHVACTSATTVEVDDGPVDSQTGDQSAIVIGLDGLPMISHYAADVDRLRITVCNDAACIDTDSTNPVAGGEFSSITIGGDGNLVISHKAGGDLGIVHLSKSAWTPGGSN